MSEGLDGMVLVRRAVAMVGATSVLEFVDTLNLRPSTRVDVVVVAPLRNLSRSRDLEGFVRNAPSAAVRFVAESLSHDQLGRVVELLGENAESPTLEQLAEAVATMLDEGAAAPLVALMLAVAAASHVPAADHCRDLLESLEVLALPDVDLTRQSATLLSEKTVDPQIREQRRRRREQAKAARATPSRASTGPSRVKKGPSSEGVVVEPPPLSSPHVTATVDRRRAVLTPAEHTQFSTDGALCGYVVAVEIAFDESNAAELAVTSKLRPALVIAAGTSSLLVRPIYSKDGPERTALGSWHRLGLDHLSYVGSERLAVAIDPGVPVRRFGRLGDEEWNALL